MKKQVWKYEISGAQAAEILAITAGANADKIQFPLNRDDTTSGVTVRMVKHRGEVKFIVERQYDPGRDGTLDETLYGWVMQLAGAPDKSPDDIYWLSMLCKDEVRNGIHRLAQACTESGVPFNREDLRFLASLCKKRHIEAEMIGWAIDMILRDGMAASWAGEFRKHAF